MGGLFRFSEAMNATTVIPTDLVTPLGAYLRLREAGAGGVPARVGRARPARPLLVRRLRLGARLVRRGGRSRRSRSSGISGTTTRRRSSRPCRCPPTGRRFRRAGSSSRHARPLRPRARLRRGALGRSRARRRRCWKGRGPRCRRRAAEAGTCGATPRGSTTSAECGRAIEHIRAGDAFQIVLSQRAERPTAASAIAIYRTLRRINPSPYNFLLELGDIALIGSSPETLVRLDGRRASVNPIAGHRAASAGRRREAARVGEGPRRARDARRPRPERPLARLRGGVGDGRALSRGGALLPRHASRLGSRGNAPRGRSGAFDLLRACFPAGTVSGAPKVRAMQIISELERLPTRAVRGRRRVPASRTARSTRASRSGRSSSRTAWRTCRPVQGSSPTRRRRPSTRSACASSPRSRPLSISRRPSGCDAAARRQLRLVHLQPRAPARGARRRGRRSAKRRDLAPTRPSSSSRPTSSSRRGRDDPRTSGATLDVIARLAPTTPTLGVCLGHQAIVEAFGGEIGPANGFCTARRARSSTTAGASSTGCRRTSPPAATTRSRPTRIPDELEVSATSEDGEVMGVRHRTLAVDGVQFHPESVLTLPLGRDLLRNFLEGPRHDPAGDRRAPRRPAARLSRGRRPRWARS